MDADNQNPEDLCEIKVQREEGAGEWFEDAESDADWVEGLSLHSSSRGGLEELQERNTVLEQKLKDAEKRVQQMMLDNERLNVQLAQEKQRSLKFQKKLKYIQDNQEIFSRLKQAYLNMKYNESTGRILTQIKDSSSQTWDGIICSTCIKTAEYKAQRDLEELCLFTGSSCKAVVVKQTAIDEIVDTVAKIKSLINEREETYDQSELRGARNVERIQNLEVQNRILQEMLKAKVERSPEPLTKTLKDSAFMKKIIFKQEKRLREMLKYNRYGKYTTSPLNENEKEFVDLIVSQYLRKLGKKSSTNIRSMSCDRNVRPELVARSCLGRGDETKENNGHNKGKKEPEDLIDFSEPTKTA